MSTTTCESRRRDKEVSDEEVSAPRVASGAERHRSGHQTCHFQELSKTMLSSSVGESRPLQSHPGPERRLVRRGGHRDGKRRADRSPPRGRA